MMRWLTVATLFALGTASALAQSPVDPEKEKAELLRLHRAAREAHFKTDVEMLLANAPDESLSVRSGKVNKSGKAERRKVFAEYFRGAKYYEWDDLEEPVISVSGDASMAWMITRIKVRRVQRDASGTEREERFVYAGLTTYEKRGGKWVRVANASTFEPPN